MKRHPTLRHLLQSPLIYIAALFLLFEDWLWDVCVRLIHAIAAWPALKALELRIEALPPYGALSIFILPTIVLLPVKIMALVAIAGGHVAVGLAVFVAARVGGAAVVARLYTLTRPSLLTLAWFARAHHRFMEVKQRWIGHLKTSASYQVAGKLGARLGAGTKQLHPRLPPPAALGERHAPRTVRVVRRLVALWRARHH